jgi:hypothetical protein
VVPEGSDVELVVVPLPDPPREEVPDDELVASPVERLDAESVSVGAGAVVLVVETVGSVCAALNARSREL